MGEGSSRLKTQLGEYLRNHITHRLYYFCNQTHTHCPNIRSSGMATLEPDEQRVQGTSTPQSKTIEWFLHLKSTYKVAVVSAKCHLQKALIVPMPILMHFASSAPPNMQKLKLETWSSTEMVMKTNIVLSLSVSILRDVQNRFLKMRFGGFWMISYLQNLTSSVWTLRLTRYLTLLGDTHPRATWTDLYIVLHVNLPLSWKTPRHKTLTVLNAISPAVVTAMFEVITQCPV